MDLLGGAFGSEAAPTSSPKNDADDLLGGIFNDMSSSAAATSKPQSGAASGSAAAAQSASDDLLGGLFDDLTVSQPAQSGGAAQGGGGGLDLLGSMTSTSPPTQSVMSGLGGGSGVFGFAALRQQLGAKVTSFSRSHETDFVLLENSTLQISYFKIFKQQKSTLCLFVSNLSGAALSNIEVAVKVDNPGIFMM